jgi:hypothetical protein
MTMINLWILSIYKLNNLDILESIPTIKLENILHFNE